MYRYRPERYVSRYSTSPYRLKDTLRRRTAGMLKRTGSFMFRPTYRAPPPFPEPCRMSSARRSGSVHKGERCAPRIARETAQVSCIPGSVFHFAKRDSRRLRATRRPTISDRQRVIPLPHRTWSTPTDIAGRKNLLTIVLRQIPEAAGVCPGFCMPTICAPENVRNKTLRRNGPRYPYRQTKISDSVPAVTPSVPDGSRMPPYTPVSCTEWLRSRGSCGSGFPQLPQCARLGGKLFGNPTLPRPWYSNRKADALREQIPATYPLRERRDERNRRRIRLGYHGRNHHAARRGFPVRLSCGREPSHSVRTERQSAWSSRLGKRGTLMPRPLSSHSSGKSNSSCPHCGCSRSAGLPILSPSSLTLP